MSQLGFIPITSNQKLFYNYKDLLQITDQFIQQASTACYDLETKTLDQLKRCISQQLSLAFVPNAKKMLKAERAKQANTSYILFCNAKRPEVKEKYPKMLPHEITQEIGKIWKNMTDEEKSRWDDQCASIANSPTASPSRSRSASLENNPPLKSRDQLAPARLKSKDELSSVRSLEKKSEAVVQNSSQAAKKVSVVDEDLYFMPSVRANKFSQADLVSHVKEYLAFFQDNVDEDLTVSRVLKMTKDELVKLVSK